MEKYLENYEKWLSSPALTEAEKDELRGIADNKKEIEERFAKGLSFGTAGLRGVMKTGWNAMNVHTVAHATQGLANLILAEKRPADGFAVAYDCRNHSAEFARTAACVLAANGVKVYLFDALRPTPELSFALRELHCVAGINITASHNPKQYNGYKAYWEDGAQLPPEHADTVSAEIAKLDIFADVKSCDYNTAVADGRITVIGAEIDEKYLAAVAAQAVNPQAVRAVADDLRIVYTPLHGTGHKLVPEIMRRVGLKHLYTVDEQMVIDGNFPTVEKPNPEYPEVFRLGIALADKVGSDLIIATDPDADRVGVMTRTKAGDFKTITGNQMGALLIDYIITAYRETNTMPPHPYVVKSIVSTELATKICDANGVKMHNVLTGFKFIGEQIGLLEKEGHTERYIFGFEESYGYLSGTSVRDKDAVNAAVLVCEMAANYKAQGLTLLDKLEQLREEFGFYAQRLLTFQYEGESGAAKMADIMRKLRAPLDTFQDAHFPTATRIDYQNDETGLPKSDVLSFALADGSKIIVRPSGTEPKLKAYLFARGENQAAAEKVLDELETLMNGYCKE